MKFSGVHAWRIPNGSAVRVRHGDKTLWAPAVARYVSLGDSIAAGHTINDDWETIYGEDSQYGKNGRTETAIVDGCYTDLIHKDLVVKFGGTVNTTSFARSGDTVADLMEKLNHEVVRNALAKADYVTVCIGANDVLQPALSRLYEYIEAGSTALDNMTADVNAGLAVLADDSNAGSYTALFNKLLAINPDAKYVFTTVYNPYKYLWIDEGADGFFKPVLSTIPDMTIFGIDVDGLIKNGILNTSAVKQLFNRVNNLSSWAETNVTKLNAVLTQKIAALGRSNFMIADTKALYDTFPDRPVSNPKHYNDLVSVEYTSGYDTMQMDWGQLYENSGGAVDFWWSIAAKYTSTSGLDVSGLAVDLVSQIVEKVIVPDVDPHPEWYGQYVLKRSFADALGMQDLDRHTITYAANGASGSMAAQTVVGVDGLPSFTNLKSPTFTPPDGHYYMGWNAAANGGSTAYSNGQYISLVGDMTLYAQWSDMYMVRVRHSIGESMPTYGSSDTGPMECYALWIDGVEQSDLGAFSNPSKTYYLPYGSQVGVIAQVKSGDGRSYVSLNGTTVSGKSADARYTFTVTSHMDIHFEWNNWADLSGLTSYWNCYVTTY